MITILWLIRSFQPIVVGDDNFWKCDWFLSTLFTILCLMADFAIFRLIYVVTFVIRG